MKRKIRFMTCIVLLIFMTSNVYAAMPDGTVVIGNKAFSLDYANDEKNSENIGSIVTNMEGGEKVLIKTETGEWYDNDGASIDKSIVPSVVYRTEKGEYIRYSKGDKDEKSEESYRVVDVSFIDRETVKITFSEPVELLKDYSEFIELGGYIEAQSFKRSQNGKEITIKLKEKITAKKYRADIKISKNTMSLNEEKLDYDFEEEMVVLNKAAESDKVFKDKVSIISYAFKGKNLKFLKGATITGDNVVLENTEAHKLIIDPGNSGNATIKNIKSEKIIIMSGGENSIHFENSTIEDMIVDSGNRVRIVAEDQTNIKKSTIISDAVLTSKGGHFNTIILPKTREKKTLEVLCEVLNIEADNNSNIITREHGNVRRLQFQNKVSFTGLAQDVLAGDNGGELNIGSGSRINNIKLANIEKINIDGFVDIEEMEGTEQQKNELKKKVEEIEENQSTEESPWRYYSKYVSGINMVSQTQVNSKHFNGMNYKCAKVSFDFTHFRFTREEYIDGILMWIKDEDNNIYDVRVLKLTSTEEIFDLRVYIENNKKFEIIIETELEGLIKFKMKY